MLEQINALISFDKMLYMAISEDVKIGSADIGDIYGIAEVLDGTLGQDFRYGDKPFEENVRYLFSRAIEDENEAVYVGKYDREVIGFAYFINKPPANGTAILEMLAVRKDMQRRGIGQKLIIAASDLFIEREKKRGIQLRTLHLTTGDYNKNAQKIYSGAGFVVAGEIRGFVGLGNNELVLVRKVSDIPCPEEYRSMEKRKNR